MKKGILTVLVLAAWVVLRNQTCTQLFVNKPHNVQQTVQLVAKTISNDLFQFTTVHLSAPEIKTKTSIHLKKTCMMNAIKEKKYINHETLLLIHSL